MSDDYCPVCDSLGFTHGPCLSCGKCKVTTLVIGDDELQATLKKERNEREPKGKPYNPYSNALRFNISDPNTWPLEPDKCSARYLPASRLSDALKDSSMPIFMIPHKRTMPSLASSEICIFTSDMKHYTVCKLNTIGGTHIDVGVYKYLQASCQEKLRTALIDYALYLKRSNP